MSVLTPDHLVGLTKELIGSGVKVAELESGLGTVVGAIQRYFPSSGLSTPVNETQVDTPVQAIEARVVVYSDRIYDVDDGVTYSLHNKESACDLIRYLTQHRGRVVPFAEIKDVFGFSGEMWRGLVYRAVFELRKALREFGYNSDEFVLTKHSRSGDNANEAGYMILADAPLGVA